MTCASSAPAIVLAAPVDIAGLAGAGTDLLCPQERYRHDRLLRPRDRQRFVAAHCLKRWALARACGVDAARLRFDRTPWGKPFLTSHRLHFNLSHGGDWVGLALHPQVPVGVDVEADQVAHTWQEVSPQIANPQDATMSPLARWTAKEALLKCHGAGFGLDPRRLPVRRASRGFAIGPSEASEGAVTLPPSITGQWCNLDANHMLAVAAATPRFRFEIASDIARLRHSLARLSFLNAIEIAEG